MRLLYHCILLSLLTCVFYACGDGGCNVVPNVAFNVTISQGSNPKLFATGGIDYASGGACGLLLYNTGNGIIAYDRCSTVNPEKRTQVVAEGFVISDPSSGAKWLLIDGSPSHIAECPLRPYRVSQNGAYYTVSN